MNVYRREMRASVRPLTLWTLGVLFFIGAAAGNHTEKPPPPTSAAMNWLPDRDAPG